MRKLIDENGMEWPLSRENVRLLTEKRISEMKSSGIRWVQVLGCNNKGEDCRQVINARNKFIPIDQATLPLPGCKKEFCKCQMLASRGPFYLLLNNVEKGPYSEEQLASLLDRGLDPATPCAQPDDVAWVPVSGVI